MEKTCEQGLRDKGRGKQKGKRKGLKGIAGTVEAAGYVEAGTCSV